MDNPFIFTHIEHLVNYDIFDTKWIPESAKFVVLGGKSNGIGILSVFELNEGKLNLVSEICKKSILKCCTFNTDSSIKHRIAVADFNGSLQILDLERMNSCVYSVNAHKEIVNSIDAVGGDAANSFGSMEIVTGGNDGIVKIWDPRQKDSPVACMVPKTIEEGGNGSRNCWSVCFGNSYNNEERFVCAGYDNGDLKIFDLRQMNVFWEKNVANGICSMEFNKKNKALSKLAISTVEGDLQVTNFNKSSQNGYPTLVESNAGKDINNDRLINAQKPTVWCVRHLPQNTNVLATCGGSGVIRLWLQKFSLNKQTIETSKGSLKMMHEVSISKQPIHCFDWCADHRGLAVCGSFDHRLRVLVTSNLNIS